MIYLLFLLFPLYFYFRNSNKFYLRHPCVQNLTTKSVSWFKWQNIVLLGLLFLGLAACNFTFKMKEVTQVYLVHKYVLVNDGSGSMVNFQKENGIGKELTAVLSGNKTLLSYLGKRNDGSKDLVGAIVFADDAYIVSYLVDDPEFVYKKLSRIDYKSPPMAGGTNIESGLWTGIEMIMFHNNIPQDTLDLLQLKFYGNGAKIKVDKLIEGIISQKDKFIGGSVIVFTDGLFPNPAGSLHTMSSYKILDFCKLAGIKAYIVSIFELNDMLVKLCKETGGKAEIVKGYDEARLKVIYEDIVSSQAQEYITKEQVVDKSLSTLFGLISFALLFIGIILQKTKQLNFTEV